MLSLIRVWQEEETQDSGDGDLEVKGLAVKLDEGWVNLDVIATTERKRQADERGLSLLSGRRASSGKE